MARMKLLLVLVGALSALLLSVGCKKAEGAACFDRASCEEGLACVGDGLKRCEKCAGRDPCTVDGRCTAKDGVCVAGSDEDCKASAGCKERGPCSAKEGVCVVGGDADCKQSVACTNSKYCVASGNNCVMSDADKKAAAKVEEAAAAAAASAEPDDEPDSEPDSD